MRLLTTRRAALLGLLVLSVATVGAAGCTAMGDRALMHRQEAQRMMATRAGGVQAEAPPKAGAATSTDPAKLGQQVAAKYGCVACHTVDGKPSVGPSWKGLFDSNREFVSGAPVKADEAYLKESIQNPNAKIAKGFLPNLMPATLGTQLKAEEIEQVIAYIKSVK